MKHLLCATLLTTLAFGQSGPNKSRPVFELADVHASTEIGWQESGPFIRGDHYEIRNFTMLDLIVAAYDLDPAKVYGGPNWLAWDRFDIVARVQPGSRPDDQKIRLQNLLADRFGLKLQREDQPVTVFGLGAGAHPKLTKADGTDQMGCKTSGSAATKTYTCRNVSMADFTAFLRKFRGYVGERDVVDLTELKGTWNFEFQCSPSVSTPNRITLFEAMDRLGLHLAVVQVTEPVVAVTRINETPTANLPGVAETLVPKVPSEFEAASVKPSGTGAGEESMWLLPGGRFSAANLPLKRLLGKAFDFLETRIEGPDWLDTARFTVEAKAPAWFAPADFATGVSRNNAEDYRATQLMLRALVTERFRIASHWESRSAPGLKLIAVKPKLNRADPSEPTRIVNGRWDRILTGLDPTDPRIAIPARNVLITYRNMTMAQIAGNFEQAAIGPVRDATGLPGSWDLTLSFTSPWISLTDADGNPTGGIHFEEALEEQAGLKIETEKQTAQFLVIDRIERMPTPN